MALTHSFPMAPMTSTLTHAFTVALPLSMSHSFTVTLTSTLSLSFTVIFALISFRLARFTLVFSLSFSVALSLSIGISIVDILSNLFQIFRRNRPFE